MTLKPGCRGDPNESIQINPYRFYRRDILRSAPPSLSSLPTLVSPTSRALVLALGLIGITMILNVPLRGGALAETLAIHVTNSDADYLG